MKPTQEIIDELRKEAAHPPTPARVAGLFTEAADRIEHLYASGIHTCHADCQRPMCVLRRERDKALAELERVKAERDAKAEECREVIAHAAKAMEDRDALRARVAELEDTLRQIATDAMDVSPHIETVALNALARAESAACQNATNGGQISSESVTPGLRTDNPIAEPVMGGLPRYEGEKLGAPAKHPDTEGDVIGEYEGKDGRRYWWTGGVWLYPGQEVAVISTRKQGGVE